jgi:NAD(P)H-hydrate epimerase
MKILTADQIREVDRRSREEFGIPGILLMENAGMRVVEALESRFGELEPASVAILCGKGNNGGDGFVVARQLLQKGCFPSVFLFAPEAGVGGDARINLDILTRTGHPPTVVSDADSWLRYARELGRVDIVVDALLGTGLSRPADGLLGEVIGSLEDEFSDALIVSVDLPSGCIADTGVLSGPVVEADLTVTFSALKHCLVFPPSTGVAGEIVLADIGNPPALLESMDHRVDLLTPDSFPEAMRPREEDTHKGDYGRLLVVGGSAGKSGAPAMAGEAALRAGAGLVTVAAPAGVVSTIAAHMPELMSHSLEDEGEDAGEEAGRADLESPEFVDLLASASVLVVGPGAGRRPRTLEFVRELVRRSAIPTLIDADGLYAFRGRTDELNGESRRLVITPHAGEMAGLANTSTEAVLADRLGIARDFARGHHLWVVLKGYRTVIASPDGGVFVNPTGNAAMATAGSGDVLAGIVAALMGQPRLGSFGERVCLGVYLHGLAGDIGAEQLGEETLTATDLVRFLPEAWSALRDEED